MLKKKYINIYKFWGGDHNIYSEGNSRAVRWLGIRLSLLWARVRSLVGEIRSHKLCYTANNGDIYTMRYVIHMHAKDLAQLIFAWVYTQANPTQIKIYNIFITPEGPLMPFLCQYSP